MHQNVNLDENKIIFDFLHQIGIILVSSVGGSVVSMYQMVYRL